MDKTKDKDDWKEVAQHASRVAKKQWATFESRLTRESRMAIRHVEAAAAIEARRVTVSILKLVAELDTNAKETIQTILTDLEKNKIKRKPTFAKRRSVKSPKKQPKKQLREKKARKKSI